LKITESNVVQHIQNKNERAISFIIDQYGGLLAAIIHRYLSIHQQEVEECLDDVLLSIWNHSHSFDPAKNSFKQWIAAIAKYKAIDYLRKQMTLQNKQFSVADIDDSMFKANHPKETNDVEHLLEQLPVNERNILEKYYLEGIPAKEIAEQFKAKESWVYNKLSRGRKRIKDFWIQNNER